MRDAVLAAVVLLLTSAPAAGGEGLYERNFAALLATLPEGAVLEVELVDGGEVVTQLWTAQQYASFRASFAAQMGRDYTAVTEGVPSGAGNYQFWGDIWSDFWGTTRLNFATPRCFPTTIPIDAPDPPLPGPALRGGGLWIYGGPGSRCGFGENRNECVAFAWGDICSSSYGWTYPQAGDEHGDAWFAFSGLIFIFPPPFGSVAYYDGLLLADELGESS